MNEFKARWITESPSFFKKLNMYGKLLVGAGGVIMAACIAAPEAISETMLHYLKLSASYMVFGGGILAAVANLKVADHSELQNKINEKTTGTDQNVG